jgi:hypothetical protein
VRRVEEEKGRQRVVGKAAGDERVFIPSRGVGVADEAGSDTIPNAAGGEEDQRVAKLGTHFTASDTIPYCSSLCLIFGFTPS